MQIERFPTDCATAGFFIESASTLQSFLRILIATPTTPFLVRTLGNLMSGVAKKDHHCLTFAKSIRSAIVIRLSASVRLRIDASMYGVTTFLTKSDRTAMFRTMPS